MKKLIALTVTAFAVAMSGIGTSTADAHLVAKPSEKTTKEINKAQGKNRAHSIYVCQRGKGAHVRWHCKAVKWLTREWKETNAKLVAARGCGIVSANPNVHLGCQMARAYGWHHGYEWEALYRLWNHESGWSAYANNPTSDACGIPQRMDNCANCGYDPRCQIAWGLRYIKDRYGRPSSAYAHLRAHNWY